MTRDHHPDDPTGRPTEPEAGSNLAPDGDDAPEVRAMLQRQADTIRPRGTYADVERRLATSAGHRPWARPALVAAAAVVALVLGAAVVATIADRDDHEVVDTAGTTDTTESPPTSTTEPDPGGTATTTASSTSAPTTTAPVTTTTLAPSTPSSTPAVPVEPITEATRVTLRGIGPVAVPAELADVSARIGVELHRDESSVLDPANPCSYVSRVAGLDGLFFMLDGTRVVRVDVDGGSASRTVSGIGIGSTEAEVEAAYPGRTATTPHPYTGLEGGHYLEVTDPSAPGYSIIFETDGTKVTSYRSGLEQYVAAIEGCA
jgi:hypothetical protein